MKAEILVKKCDAKWRDKLAEKDIILWTKDVESTYLGTTHKIKLAICAVWPWICTHFKCIQICYILQ